MKIIYVVNGVKNIRNKTQYQHSKMLVEDHDVVTVTTTDVAPFLHEDSTAVYCFSEYPGPQFLFPYFSIIISFYHIFNGYSTIFTTHSSQCLLTGVLGFLPNVTWIADIWDDPRLGGQIRHYRDDKKKGLLPNKPYSKTIVFIVFRLLQYCDLIILSISEEIILDWPVTLPENKIYASTNGVDLGYTQTVEKTTCNKDSRNNDRFDIVYVGHVGRVRGLDVIVETAHKLKTIQSQEFRFVLVGSIDEQEQTWLDNKLDNNEIGHMVDVCGQMEHREALRKIAMSDICINILPLEIDNYYYSYPIKILEYMALEKPIISTETNGIQTLLEDGYSALLLPNNNPSTLQEAILQLSTNKEYRLKIAKNAQRNIDQYDWKRITNMINEEISQL